MHYLSGRTNVMGGPDRVLKTASNRYSNPIRKTNSIHACSSTEIRDLIRFV